jgi:DNA polymerase-3 subunit alpha
MRFSRHSDEVFGHLHVHSTYSSGDAISSVATLVAQATANGQPMLGLTDHGNMSGAVSLYTEAMKAGIRPFIGEEFYIVRDRADKKAKRHHLGVLATTSEGYRNIVALSSRSHAQFYHKPLLDLNDLAEIADDGRLRGLVALSGCYSGLPTQDLLNYGADQARTMLGCYSRWFDQVYVELMNHGIIWDDLSTDADINDALFDLAQQMGLPVLVTGDVHYCHPEQKHLHDSFKRLVSYGSGDDDGVFRGAGYYLADTPTMKKAHPAAHWIQGLAGAKDIQQRWDLSIPQLDHYSYRVPIISADPVAELRKRVGGHAGEQHLQLLDEELGVIEKTGMSGYMLLVAEVTDYLREQGIIYQVRGSASGSLVCYRLGITAVDPVARKLRYERFISTDRTKPPDIDIDVDFLRRGEVLDWLREHFSVHQIGTYLDLGLTDGEDGKGSLVVKYMAKSRAKGLLISWDQVPEEDKITLAALANIKVNSGYGVHAAGLVLTTSEAEFATLVPTMFVASSKTTVSQYTMGDVERLGLVKLDLLGLRALSTIRGCLENIDRDPRAGLDWIPENDAETLNTVRRGDTVGVFQFDGYTNRRGARDMRVTNLDDIIAVMALYRPAVMGSGGTAEYLARRFGKHKVPTLHPVLAASLHDTHGLVVFQEQVIDILRALGMNPDDLTALLKAVKASNNNVVAAAEVIASYGSQVFTMADKAGVPEAEANLLWRAIEGYADYGFNRAHATVYGLTAYRTAYLKTHHTVAYFAALLSSFEGTKEKEPFYRSDARNHGVRIRPAVINVSNVSYTYDRSTGTVRRGLCSIKGIGVKAAEHLAAHGPYTSLADLIAKCGTKPVTGGKDYLRTGLLTDLCGTLEVLYLSGALDDLDLMLPEPVVKA